MNTAEERFDRYVWYVLDKIAQEALPNRLGEVSYTFNIDITRTNPISYTSERKALDYLLNNKVIEKIGEDVLAEGGEKGMKSYYVEEIYRFKIKKKFYDFYDRFQYKVFALDTEKSGKIMKRIIQNLSESLDGKYEKLLITFLSKGDKTAKELEETGARDVRHLISNTNKKLVKRGFKISLTRIKDTDGLRKYHFSTS
jgi:hypothetical protein